MNILEEILESIYPILLTHLLRNSLSKTGFKVMKVLSVVLYLKKNFVKNPESTLKVEDFIISVILIFNKGDSLFEESDLFVFEFKFVFILSDTFKYLQIVFEIIFMIISLSFGVFLSM